MATPNDKDKTKNTGNRLTKEQKALIIEKLAAYETHADIAALVGCHENNIDHYAKTYKEQIAKQRLEYDAKHINRGIRAYHKRIEKLDTLRGRLEQELYREPKPIKDDKGKDTKELDRGGLYATDLKITPRGKVIKYSVYNSALVNDYHKVLRTIEDMENRWYKDAREVVSDKGGDGSSTIVRVVYEAYPNPNDKPQ